MFFVFFVISYILIGCTAAAHVAYALSDSAVIYPITPSTPMGAIVDKWSAEGRKNIFDQVLQVTEMQSEAGAAGAVHGSLAAGALTTTFTASQGLLLMIPNMYKIAGERLPAVFHVTARAVAGQALSIFGDHSDVMATRQTGFSLLNSATVQESMDMAIIAHMAAIITGMPFIHFFDGFRTSHEIQKIKIVDYPTIKSLIDFDAIESFRSRTLNPEHPQMRGTSQQPEIFFQLVESNNIYYNKIPGVVQECMNKLGKITKRRYHLFEYVGHAAATHIVVAMGSGASTMEEVVKRMIKEGEKVGVVKVRLFRPWDADAFMESLPRTATHICVLDRSKEAGSFGEPLYLDVAATLQEKGENRMVIGGRYGLGSKDLTGAMGKAVFDNLKAYKPKRHFTIGIDDNLTYSSLPVGPSYDCVPKGTVQCLLWGYGSDGTVGANKEAIKIIGEKEGMYCQGYFEYDAKKSGGLTRSHLRFGPKPINAPYLVDSADYIACHNPGYVGYYHLLKDAREGGTFVLNCPWETIEELEERLSSDIKRDLGMKKMKFFVVNAQKVAEETGMGNHINMIMQTAFFKLSQVLSLEVAVESLKQSVTKIYSRKGDEIVKKNIEAIDKALDEVKEIEVPENWSESPPLPKFEIKDAPEFVNEIMVPCQHYEGDTLPVSLLRRLCPGGIMPTNTSKYEKRGFASSVAHWNPDKCVQCNQCSVICPHAACRPFLVTDSEVKNAPNAEIFQCKKANSKELEGFQFRIQISPLDCTGCGSCVTMCPCHSLSLVPLDDERGQAKNWDYTITLPIRDDIITTTVEKPNIKASQFKQPYLEFSGACGGCGETPYVKLVTQLFGDRMLIANATGCSSIWGGSAPFCPYTVNKEGHGPAWGNSLFEDGAEYGYGMFLATKQRRSRIISLANSVVSSASVPQTVKEAAQEWITNVDNSEKSKSTGDALKRALEPERNSSELLRQLWDGRDLFTKKSQWIIGGDGWAYDIGYGGLDHVLSCEDDVNVLVLDTEVYSNTGGQKSKATPRGATAQFATSGKKTTKKNLGVLFMSYQYIYVAQVCLAANPTQCLRALQEAEAYPGPSIVIAYAPCINHGIQGGLMNMSAQEKNAVKYGYWHLYRFNPLLAKDGKNPFILDSAAPSGDLKEFLYKEVRFNSLTRQYKEEAERLHEQLVEDKKMDYTMYKKLAENAF